MSAVARRAGAVWALVPVKAFSVAKSRLTAELGPKERAAFARRLFEHVLDVLALCSEVGGTMVVTSCPEVASLARARGATVVADVVPEGLGLIVDGGLRELAARDAGGALVLMSDLPLLTAVEVHRLLEMMRRHPLVVAPDDRDQGTNALGLSPPDLLSTFFGHADSFDRHHREGAARALDVGVLRSPGLGFDVDGPDDLARLRARVFEQGERVVCENDLR
ncbi:MAG: 2-phospho-L-lactate guanylyltransferase [Minicystis sp.]